MHIKILPGWSGEQESSRKQVVIQRWKGQTGSFQPLQVSIGGQNMPLVHTQILPLWHGSHEMKCESICTSGFTYFGKHHFFDNTAEAGPASSTDKGYFGSGIYFTNSARYAALYARGHMLLSWVSMREPYPVINDIPLPQKGSAMNMLEGKGAYQNYNTHFIPVVCLRPNSQTCTEYFPCHVGDQPVWDEVVVFQRSQTLCRFWVELTTDTPAPLIPQGYNFATGYAACQQGNLVLIQTLIQENPQRLLETDAAGETLCFAAVKGHQLTVLQWLCSQNGALLKATRLDGCHVQHLAAALGDTAIFEWIHSQDSLLITQKNMKQETPLHVAALTEQISILKLFTQIVNDIPFILKLVTLAAPKTVEFLLSQGLNVQTSNTFQQTLLHLAAQAGQEENARLLLQYGAVIDAQDRSKRTPLFVAVVQGHRSLVQLLLASNTQIDLASVEGETIFHAAAFYGCTPILQDLFSHIKTPLALLSKADSDGKVPLHKAVWGAPKPDVVALFIKQGVDVNALNNFLYTPLHWACKHGHLNSLSILIAHRADPTILNKNGDLPLDLALQFRQTEILHFFLDTVQRVKSASPSKEIFEHDMACLKQALQLQLIEEQIIYLEYISAHYLERRDFEKAALFLNAAHALVQSHKKSSFFEHHLRSSMERVERLFLQAEGIEHQKTGGQTTLSHRQKLEEYRKECVQQDFSPKILKNLTTQYCGLLNTLITEAQAVLGPAPVKWVCLGLGSMARGEMCPFSDIEFAFVIESENPESIAYFHRLFRLLRLMVINLGETPCALFEFQSLTHQGFCMDPQGFIPIGGMFELIGTPDKLAELQTKDMIVASALHSFCEVVGDPKLAKQYFTQKAKVQATRDNKKTPQHERLALRLLNDAIKGSYHPTHKGPLSIKESLYCPVQRALHSLALYYKIDTGNTFEQIDALYKCNVLSQQGASNLKKALSLIFQLRLETQLFYKSATELLHPIETGKPLDKEKLYLTPERMQTIQTIYQLLAPFYQAVQQFCTHPQKGAFNT